MAISAAYNKRKIFKKSEKMPLTNRNYYYIVMYTVEDEKLKPVIK